MTTFVTGFPGFLGSALVDRLVADPPGEADVTCLVQPKYRSVAEDRAEAIERANGAPGAIELVEGDITEPDLGLRSRYRHLRSRTTAAYHLAAVYDLGVGRSLARRVNVDGTRHFLDFVEGTSDLDRLHHVSTCYVSGRHEGRFGPEDLLVGQRFNNHYEATKFQAEVAVRRAMDRGLPATIYRPGIVVGDSRTGETAKYDGPYQVVRFLLRQPRVAVLPMVGDPTSVELNVVPREYVIGAIDALRKRPESEGETYQLANPAPPTVDEFVDRLAAAAERRVVRVPVPKAALKGALAHVPGLSTTTGIQPELVDYFDLPTRYDTAKTVSALEDTDLTCPPLHEYLDTLVEFVRANPDAATSPMA
jgi:thioester reductase-like protein